MHLLWEEFKKKKHPKVLFPRYCFLAHLIKMEWVASDITMEHECQLKGTFLWFPSCNLQFQGKNDSQAMYNIGAAQNQLNFKSQPEKELNVSDVQFTSSVNFWRHSFFDSSS